MAEDVNKKYQCCFHSETLEILMKFVFLRCVLLCLYILDITSDIAVAYDDYMKGNLIFSYITFGLIFVPGLIFALYMLCDSCWRYAGELSSVKGFLWLTVVPLLPLWPILWDIKFILKALGATIFLSKRKIIMKKIEVPSRTYLLKFLEAFTEAAPQLVVRLLKSCLHNPLPFSELTNTEITQISFSLFVLSMNVISTHQKNVSTQQVMNGDLESENKYTLSCFGKIFALCWWLTFIFTRIQAIALFSSIYHFWIFLIIGIHVGLMFMLQTTSGIKEKTRKIIIYFFAAFVFIFTYIQFNLTSRVKVGAWVSYTMFTILVFLENIVMLTCWLYKQKHSLDFYIEDISNGTNNTIESAYSYQTPANHTWQPFLSNNFYDTNLIQETVQNHSDKLLLIHYGLFASSLLFMTLTFMCPFTKQNVNNDVGTELEKTELRDYD